jgi:hypothetical protein
LCIKRRRGGVRKGMKRGRKLEKGSREGKEGEVGAVWGKWLTHLHTNLIDLPPSLLCDGLPTVSSLDPRPSAGRGRKDVFSLEATTVSYLQY